MAANNLQEAGLILTAQGAEEFKSAMKGISAATKEAYSELKLAQSQYDKNTSVTQKLADKQKYLQKMTEEYTKKEQVLRAELEQMESAENRDETAIAKKKAEVNNCKAALNKYEKSLEDVTKQIKTHSAQLKEWGEKLKDVGGKMQSIGNDLTKNVTAPIMAVGAASIAAFNEVDEGYDTVIKKTGATGAAADELCRSVDELATRIPTDFATAGTAIGEVNTRFGLTGEELEDLSEQFIKFAQLNETDVNSAIDQTQKVLEVFGLKAEDAGYALDVLNKAGQDSGISMDTMFGLITSNGEALDELGIGLEGAADMMAKLEKSGVPVETVMGGLSKALKKAAEEGKPLDKALAELQQSMADCEDDTEGLKKAYEIFGKSGDKVFKAVRDGSLNFSLLGYNAEDAAGSVSDTFEETLDPLDQWQTVLNELKLAGADLAETIGPILVPIIQGIGDTIRDLKEKWDSLSPGVQDAIVKAAMVAAVVGPIVAIVGGLITGIGSLIAAVGTIAGVLGVAASTVGIVIAAIVLLGIQIGYLIAHWDEIKEKVREVWESIVTWVSDLKEKVVAKWEEIKNNLHEKIESIKSTMKEKWEAIKTDAVEKVTKLKDDAVAKIQELKNKITEKLNEIKSKFTEKFDEIKNKVQGFIDDIKGFFENLKLKIPKPELPALPHFSLEWSSKTVLGKEISYPSGLSVDWYAKAMDTPYLLTRATVMQTPYGTIGAGEAGREFMYGYDNLMRDITAANAINNEQLIDAFYDAMVAALKQSNLTVRIGRREFGRILREAET